jgi:hypothetical protein
VEGIGCDSLSTVAIRRRERWRRWNRVFWRRAPKKSARLLQRVCHRQTICLRKLGDDRAEKVKFRRFLMNDRVTVSKMVTRQRARVAAVASGRHVLAIQDTSEINYEAQRERKHGLGTAGPRFCLAGRPEKYEYSRQYGSHRGNPGLNRPPPRPARRCGFRPCQVCDSLRFKRGRKRIVRKI